MVWSQLTNSRARLVQIFRKHIRKLEQLRCPERATNPNPDVDRNKDANRDPITGTPGSHPVGTGLGAAAGGIAGGIGAGALAGSMGGPIGTAVGAVVGAVAGGLAGKGIAEVIDPTAEETYWRTNYESRPYVRSGSSFDDYGSNLYHACVALSKKSHSTNPAFPQTPSQAN